MCNIHADYPIKPPTITCSTDIWHPNIDENGAVCLNILKEVTVGGDWRPNLDVNACILGLIFLFIEPNPNDPLNQKAAQDLRERPEAFINDVQTSLKGGTVNGKKYPKFI